jgi:hypothetical protein
MWEKSRCLKLRIIFCPVYSMKRVWKKSIIKPVIINVRKIRQNILNDTMLNPKMVSCSIGFTGIIK